MSRSHSETISCSTCRNIQEFTVWESVNVSVDPELKQLLLNGDLTTFHCANCGHEAHVAFDCLYHDMDRSLALWLKYPDDSGTAHIDPAALGLLSAIDSKYKCRIVTSFHELLDKIRVFEDGFSIQNYFELTHLDSPL